MVILYEQMKMIYYISFIDPNGITFNKRITYRNKHQLLKSLKTEKINKTTRHSARGCWKSDRKI